MYTFDEIEKTDSRNSRCDQGRDGKTELTHRADRI